MVFALRLVKKGELADRFLGIISWLKVCDDDLGILSTRRVPLPLVVQTGDRKDVIPFVQLPDKGDIVV